MREIRLSGSVEGVMSNCDPYSDSPGPWLVGKPPKLTRVQGADIVMESITLRTDDPASFVTSAHVKVWFAVLDEPSA
jgi:hypothetical protein